jgi:hypothetical protein
VNCGSPRPGEYCAACGERRMHRQTLKLSAFVSSALEEITDFDHSKLLNTLKVLILRPGVLTTEYLRGRRKRYLGPFKIYLTAFALSFLLYSVYRPTSVYDVRNFLAQDQTGTWHQLIAQLGKKVALPGSVVIAQLNERWQHYVSLSNALYPLGVALLLKVFYLPVRRYYTEHLIFSLHFSSLAHAIFIVLWPAYAFTGLRISTAYFLVSAVSLGLLSLWLLLALREVYRQSWLATALKTAVVMIGYYLIGILIVLGAFGLAFFILFRLY